MKDRGRVFFITDNKTDFSDPNKSSELHPHLQLSFSKAKILYDPHLAKILKEQFGQDIDKADIEFEEEIIQMPRYQARYFGSGFGSGFAHGAGIEGEACISTVLNSTGPPQDYDRNVLFNFQDGEGIP